MVYFKENKQIRLNDNIFLRYKYTIFDKHISALIFYKKCNKVVAFLHLAQFFGKYGSKNERISKGHYVVV
jgi:hypothetical protein